MAYSHVTYVGDGSTTVFAVPFPYISPLDVAVTVAGAPVEPAWLTDASISLVPAPVSGSLVKIQRRTSPETRKVEFNDSSNLTAATLNKDSLQAFYLAQESADDIDSVEAGISGEIQSRLTEDIDIRNTIAELVVGSLPVEVEPANNAVPRAGSTGRLSRKWLGDVIDIRDYGAVCNSLTDDTTAIRNAITGNPGGHIIITGVPVVTSGLNLSGFGGTIEWLGGAYLKAGANDFKVFFNTTNSWGCRLIDLRIKGTGTTGVIAGEFSRFNYNGAAIVRPYLRDMHSGFILTSLNFGLSIEYPCMVNVLHPIKLLYSNSAVIIHHPIIDGYGEVEDDPAIEITSDGNIGVKILGGFIQAGKVGLRDSGRATQVLGTYFENNDEDIDLVNSKFFSSLGTNHAALVGASAYRLRNSDGALIVNPYMGSGARSTGLLDSNGSNTNCSVQYTRGAATENVPLGVTTGINFIYPVTRGTFTPVVAGTTSAGVGTYTVQWGRYTQEGKRVTAEMFLTWTAHTGTGNISVTGLPVAADSAFLTFHQGPVVFSGGPYTGPGLTCYLNGTGNNITVAQVSTAGALSFVALPAAGSLKIRMEYDTP
jgi:hypothetical protein